MQLITKEEFKRQINNVDINNLQIMKESHLKAIDKLKDDIKKEIPASLGISNEDKLNAELEYIDVIDNLIKEKTNNS